MKDPYKVKKKDMQKHKYLERAGMPRKDCGTNFAPITKHMRKERRKYGFDRRETYDVGDMFMQWLYEHLCMYTDIASKIIDFETNIVPTDHGDKPLGEAVEWLMEPLSAYVALSPNRYTSSAVEIKCNELMTEASRRWSYLANYINW